MLLPQPPLLASAPLVRPASAQKISQINAFPQFGQNFSDIEYNVPKPPKFQESEEMQAIIDDAVSLVEDKGLPKTPLSITLIDVRSRQFAGYQQQQLRYPASVVKLFWMVVLFAEIEKGMLPTNLASSSDLYNMIQNSDNEAASRILDVITNTHSGSRLNGDDFQIWLKKRNLVNNFFQTAGYENININQKVYPISYLRMDLPEGRDAQMRANSDNASRNVMTTSHVGRLLYEIFTRQAVSPEASQRMESLLTRNLSAEEKSGSSDMSPIELLLGKPLPNDTYFASKAGWTSTTRNEAAYISTRDGEVAYILVIFGDDSAYADNEGIFSKISRLVYDRMKSRYSANF